MGDILRIKELANSQGISLSSLCKRIGKTRTYLSEIYNRGRSVPNEYVPALAEALHTTPEYLMGKTDDPEQGIKKEPTSLMADRFDGDVLAIMEIVQHLSLEDKALVLERCRTLYEKEKQ